MFNPATLARYPRITAIESENPADCAAYVSVEGRTGHHWLSHQHAPALVPLPLDEALLVDHLPEPGYCFRVPAELLERTRELLHLGRP